MVGSRPCPGAVGNGEVENPPEDELAARLNFAPPMLDRLVSHVYTSGMARPRSEDKRKALMAAATRVIVAQGLSAPTAVVAREAGVSNGSLFTYFDTKAELFNQLYF